MERSWELGNERTRKVEQKCPGIELQEMKSDLASRAYYHDTHVINFHGVSMAIEVVRLWCLKEGMQWEFLRSIENPKLPFPSCP